MQTTTFLYRGIIERLQLIANHALIAHELQWKGSDLYRICGSTMLFGGAVSTLLLFSEHKQILMCNQ